MDDFTYFKDMLESIKDYKKIILLIYIIKQDNELLLEQGMTDEFIKKLYKGTKKILNRQMEDYFDHIHFKEEEILELSHIK